MAVQFFHEKVIDSFRIVQVHCGVARSVSVVSLYKHVDPYRDAQHEEQCTSFLVRFLLAAAFLLIQLHRQDPSSHVHHLNFDQLGTVQRSKKHIPLTNKCNGDLQCRYAIY